MAKRKQKKERPNFSPKIVGRRAYHDFEISEKLEVGMQLRGSEVKQIRNGRITLTEGFGWIDPKTEELWLVNADIPPYPQAGPLNHEPRRSRKLLAHRRQIAHLLGKTQEKGTTLVPLAVYFNAHGIAKLELGVGKGKRKVDKRQDLKKKEHDREMRREMAKKVL
jgi:SsrA-binding protein